MNGFVKKTLVFVTAMIMGISSAASDEQSHYDLNSAAQLNGAIASPEKFLGFKVGSRPVRNDEVIFYFRHLAEVSDRVIFSQYGETPSGQKLVKLIISSPENLKNLKKIKSNQAKISGGKNSGLIRETPLVAWMGYGIHGDEISSTDAALMLAYRLAAGQDKATGTIRHNVITHIDPMFNPDGRMRALSHLEIFRRTMASTDHQDIVHGASWPAGRGNKYLFDLNRDALFQTQEQSRQRVKAIREASPQLFVDSHEMGWDDTYLFAVPGLPLNPHLPAQIHKSWLDVATDHSAAFDLEGISYYTRSWDEIFYPGYFDVWPAYYGAVPILYEQAATSGLSVKKTNGKILTFSHAVANHYRSSVASLLTAATRKDTLIRRWAEAGQAAQKSAAGLVQKSYILLPDDRYKYREILRILLDSGVKVQSLEKSVKAKGLHSYWEGRAQQVTLPAGSLKIDMAQPLSYLVRNIFDYHVPMTPEFLKKEKHNLDLGHPTQLYDITAWSLPLAFNAPVFWSEGSVKGSWKKIASQADVLEKPAPLTAAKYGYIYIDDSLFSTARLIEKGLKIRVATEPFVHQGTSYPRGSFLVRLEDQEGDVLAALKGEAGSIRLVGTDSARILQGPDLGGPEYSLLDRPRIALLGGAGVSSTSFGAAWHLFDREIGLPVTLLDVASLGDVDLAKYTIVVFPETEGGIPQNLKDGALEKWVDNGGLLISLGEASFELARQELVSSKPRSEVLGDYPPLMAGRSRDAVNANDFLGFSANAPDKGAVLAPVIGDVARRYITGAGYDLKGKVKTFSEWVGDVELTEERRAGFVEKIKQYLPKGAYLRSYLKPEHWLAYGVGDKIPVLFRGDDVLIGGEGAKLIGRYGEPEKLMMSGLVWPEAVGYIAGGAYLLQEDKGDGQYILFTTDPLFRGYSLGTSRLFMNALVMGRRK